MDVDEPFGQSEDSEGQHLAFLKEEGLEMLALFRNIRSKKKRDLIVELIRVMTESQGDPDDNV